MRVFLDTNILVDLLVRRDDPRYGAAASLILQLGKFPEFELCMSVISVPTIAYVMKGMNTEQKKSKLRTICSYVKVLNSDESQVTRALDGKFKDIEDAMQAACALDHGCDVIVTRNVKDFSESTVPATEPLQFVARITRANKL